MTDLLLVRHGLSEWNRVGRWQGWADVPLAEEGAAQSREARPALRDLGLTAVVHSGMRRTARTAELLTEGMDLTVEVEPGLKEYDVGEWSGLTRPEIEQQWPGALDAWFQGRLPATPGGESRDGFATRLLDAVHRVALTHPGGTVLCVSHGGVVNTLQRVLSGGDQPGPRIGNLSGRWVHVNWEGEPAGSRGTTEPAGSRGTTQPAGSRGRAERATVALGELVHLLPPAQETESPSA